MLLCVFSQLSITAVKPAMQNPFAIRSSSPCRWIEEECTREAGAAPGWCPQAIAFCSETTGPLRTTATP